RFPSQLANGLTFDAQRRLIACEGASRRLTRAEPDGSLTVLAETYQGKHINSPNDVVVAADGSIYFSDPFWGGSFVQPARLGPDGMKVDVEGNVYCTGPGGVWVVAPTGEPLGRIEPPEVPANCAWGGADWRTLYMTARSGVYRVRLNVAGVPVP